MRVEAKLRYLRIAPRKVNIVAKVIKGMDVEEADAQLKFVEKRAGLPLAKLLKSAVANATNNFNLEKKNLYIKDILVGAGPTLKRWRARSRGRANVIRKRTSHIKIILEEKVATKKAKAGKVALEKSSEKAKESVIRKENKFKPVKKAEKPKTEITGKRKIFSRKSI